VLTHGFKIVEIPIIFMDRRVGKSKMSRKIFIEGFLSVLRIRFAKQTSTTPQTHITLQQTDTSTIKSTGEELPSVVQK